MGNFQIKELKRDLVDSLFFIEREFFDVKNIDSILSSLDSDRLHYFLLFLDEKLIGFLEFSIVLDEVELYEIAICKEFQGKGYSNKLMDFLFSYCKEHNARTIFLEVNKNNTKAISLYNKFGFSQYSIRKKYYGEDDAILMKCSI